MSCIKDAFDVTYLLSSVHAVPNIYVIWCGIRLWAQPYLFASGILWSSFGWKSNCACAGLPLWKHLLKRVPFVKIHQDPTELSICKQNESKAFCKNREKKMSFLFTENYYQLCYFWKVILYLWRDHFLVSLALLISFEDAWLSVSGTLGPDDMIFIVLITTQLPIKASIQLGLLGQHTSQ